jgi:hypothetical protein
MPFINTRTNTTITPEQESSIKAKLGDAIRCLGKSEGWLMLNFEDNCRLWFKGDNSQDSAIVDVDLLGGVSKDGALKMTCTVCDILEEELGISPSRVYVKYMGYADWGWNNTNF